MYNTQKNVVSGLITKEEKQYLLNVNAIDFMYNLGSRANILKVFKTSELFNVDLVAAYNICLVIVSLYFYDSLSVNHRNIEYINYFIKSFTKKDYLTLKLKTSILTGFMWDEQESRVYNYSVEFNLREFNEKRFVIVDEVSSLYCCSQLNAMHCFDLFDETGYKDLLFDFLIIYNDFIDSMFVKL